MAWLKNMLNRILFPPVVLLVAFVPLATYALVRTFMLGTTDNLAAYISYLFSAYTLTIICVRMPAVVRNVAHTVEHNRLYIRYKSDPQLRVRVSLYATTAFNTLYAVLQLVSAIYHQSLWFYALGAYYIILAAMRFFLLRDTSRASCGVNKAAELRRYRFCGILLILENIALGVIVAYIVWKDRGFEYTEVATIAMATYTFCATIIAIVNVRKYRRYESPLLSAAKAISLSAALVSMLSLETAMISAFGDDSSTMFRRMMTAVSGAFVCVAVLAMAVFMVAKSTREISRATCEKDISKGNL